MSIHLRLNIAIVILLAITLAATSVAVILDARPRIAQESESTTRLTQALIASSLFALEGASDPHAMLRRLVASFQDLRHVSVRLKGADARADEESAADASSGWRGFLDDQPPEAVEVPAYAAGTLLDVILITPKTSDELQEIWAAVGRIFEYGGLLLLVLVPLTSSLTRRSLAPVSDLAEAMRTMEAGDYTVRIPESGPPEIREGCVRLNRLAGALQSAREEVQALSLRMVRVQDEERRDVVRELHDDLGPHLFTLRARASALERLIHRDAPALQRAASEAAAIAQQVDALQQTNRRVLSRLAPEGLQELGLERSIQAMASRWRKEQPGVALSVQIRAPLDQLSETARLTIYRVCQEGLTNAYRHARAREIVLSIAGEPSMCITITDDGLGLPSAFQLGQGLAGMRERVRALGGTLDMQANPPGGGTRLVVKIPALT